MSPAFRRYLFFLRCFTLWVASFLWINSNLTYKASKSGTETIFVEKEIDSDHMAYAQANFVATVPTGSDKYAGYGFHNSGTNGAFLYLSRTDSRLHYTLNNGVDYMLLPLAYADYVETTNANGGVYVPSVVARCVSVVSSGSDYYCEYLGSGYILAYHFQTKELLRNTEIGFRVYYLLN